MPSAEVRRSVYYSGRVQGVGFRYTARHIAQSYAVSGFVRNLPDRRVELVVEGNESEIQRFFDNLGEKMSDFIHSADATSSTATGEFREFEIRH